MEVNARDLVAPSFVKLLKAAIKHEAREYCMVGGRGSTKSSFISIVIVILIIMFPNINALICRKYSNTLRESVYEQMLWAIEKLGVSGWFKCTVSPMQIEYIATGQKIIFRGVDNPVKLKSLKLKKGYFGILWFEESTEFRPEEVRSVKQTVMRGGEDFWIFDSFNPPTARGNWKNADALIEKPGRIVHRSDYRDVPVEWLSDAFVEEAKWLEQTNPRLYANEYMGECTGNGLDVFENLKDVELTDKQIGAFDYFFHGIDWGYYPDPWAYTGMAYDPAKRILYIFDECAEYKKGNQESSDILFNHFLSGPWAWYTRTKPKHLSELGVKLCPDSAEPKSISDYRAYGWHCVEPVKTGLRDYGFKWLQSLTAICIDRKRAPKSWAEFSGYEYETARDGTIISTYPEGQADHHIACVRYAMEEVYRRKGL
jgi:phage terminase large subunit